MTEDEIIQNQIDNLYSAIRDIRVNLYELGERDKIISNQIMILENIKTQIIKNNNISNKEEVNDSTRLL